MDHIAIPIKTGKKSAQKLCCMIRVFALLIKTVAFLIFSFPMSCGCTKLNSSIIYHAKFVLDITEYFTPKKANLMESMSQNWHPQVPIQRLITGILHV